MTARLSPSHVPDLEDRGPDLARAAGHPPHRSTFERLMVSLRPEQWTKNLVVFAGLLFGGRLTEPNAILLAVAAFMIFCALSGAVYLFNDVADRDADQQHPLKRMRPIASGQFPVKVALLTAGVLGAVAYTVGKYGVGSLKQLVSLFALFYVSVAIFVLGVLGGVMALAGLNIFQFLGYLLAEPTLVLRAASPDRSGGDV